MTIDEMKQRELEAIKKYPVAVQEQIKRNMEQGLLCACNQEMIPYFPQEGELADPHTHGTKLSNGVLHGYDDCAPTPA